MKIKILSLLIVSMTSSLYVHAFEYAKADSAYNAKNYEEAVALYTQAIEEEGVSAGILYNLGNAYYRLGNDGEAVLCYERAKRLDPGNGDINRNLTFMAAKVADANKGELQGKNVSIEPDSESFIGEVYNMIAVETQSDSWAVFAVTAFILFLGSLALYVFTPNVLARKTGFFSGLIFLGFTAVFLIFSFIGAEEYTRDDQIILTDYATSLREKPSETANESSSPLHKGTKLTVLETKKGEDGKDWLKVKLNSDNIGWVKKERVETI